MNDITETTGNNTAAAGWFRDPTARHTMRYWDGAGWTQHVQFHDATTGIDPMAPQPPRHMAAATSSTPIHVGGAGIAGAGALLAGIVSCTAVDWFHLQPGPDSYSSAQSFTRGDISTLVGFAGDSVNSLTKAFFDFGWVGMLLALAWCAAVSYGVLAKSRTAAIAACAAMTGWSLFAIQNAAEPSDGDVVTVQFGAYLLIAAGIVALVAAVAGRPRSGAATPARQLPA